MNTIKSYNVVGDTLNDKVNIEKLHLEVRTSTVSNYLQLYPFGNKIHIEFSDIVSPEDLIELTNVVNNHDGEEATTTKNLIEERTAKFNELVQMAIYHPILDSIETNGYLISIDNHKNAFLTDGIKDNIVAKIIADSASGDFVTYLNQIVNPAGNKTFEFLINEINQIS